MKAKTLPGCKAAWPVGAADLGDRQVVVLVEGGPDLLAAAHFAYLEFGCDPDWLAYVAMLGAGQRIPEEALQLLAKRRLRIVVQADPAGKSGALRWAGELRRAGCEVDGFSCEGLRRPDGKTAKDLADLARWPLEQWHAGEDAELEPATPFFRRVYAGLQA